MASRIEQEIFNELAALCASPGYVHAIALLCFRDQYIPYDDFIQSKNYLEFCSHERLIRTEISTLIGLMVRAPLNFTVPESKTLESYIACTETLLKELHAELEEPLNVEMRKAFAHPAKAKEFSPFSGATVLREPIFYGGEWAYGFQYRDFSIPKYEYDEDWLRIHKCFSAKDARDVSIALYKFLNDKLLKTLQRMRGLPPEKWSLLDGFQFSIADIMTISDLPQATVESVIDAFTCPEGGNSTFISLNEFNAVNAFPILKADEDNYILFLHAGLMEALYNTPFYWMNDDKTYASAAMKNRGIFAEKFTAGRLENVFGADNVFRNVDIWDTSSHKTKLGEIDALVLIGDRAIVIQAKSKKLTLAARKGSDLRLQADFKAAVQDACDQAVSCSQELLAQAPILTANSGKTIKMQGALKKIYPICVVSDHYPALTFQAQQFLAFKPIDNIEQPLICDVFFIDVVTEFLDTPLYFLNYLDLRARAANKLCTSSETVALGFHLKRNLWLEEYDSLMLTDDCSVDVDIAMMARREGIDGEKVPPGILTHLKGTTVGHIIAELEGYFEPAKIGVGLELLKLDGESANIFSQTIDKISYDATKDGKPHTVTAPLSQTNSGITVHCNRLPDEDAGKMLERHCTLHKYKAKADTWFGLLIQPGDSVVRFARMLDYPWQQDTVLDAAVSKMAPPMTMESIRHGLRHPAQIDPDAELYL